MRYRFLQQHQRQFPLRVLCRVLGVSPSGYYAWRSRPESVRSQKNRQLLAQLTALHRTSRGTYGRRRMQRALRDHGQACSCNRVARLLRQAGLCARSRRRTHWTTDSRHAFPVAPNRLARNFTASAPNQVWVSDITYLRTEEGWLYLATVLDLHSRRIVGWSMQETLARSLTLAALDMAVTSRQPPPGLLHHSDRGSQYACADYQTALTRHHMICSMSRKGDVWDNAPQESFFGTLKGELPRAQWATRAQARREVFEYLEVWYNRQRLHSSLGYQSPAAYEKQYLSQAL